MDNSILQLSLFNYTFIQNALLAVLIMSPLFAILGTMVVNNKMSFFSEALGHSALTGIALGSLIGISNYSVSMIIFAIVFALVLNYIKNKSKASTDTIIAVCSSTCIAIGLTILSSNGGINKYSTYLIGDILSVTSQELKSLALVLTVVVVIWVVLFNKLLATSSEPTVAKTKGINTKLVENIFVILIAVVVMLTIKWVGILVINALIIIPAASSRNISKNMRSYTFYALIFSVVSGLLGVAYSYYLNVATGPTIVCISAIIYFITLIMRKK